MEMKEHGDFLGQHYLDIFHILRNVRKKLEVKEHLAFFSRLIRAKNQQQYDWGLNEAESKLTRSELTVLERFKANAHLFCLSQLKKEFIGFSCSSSLNEGLHNRLKSLIPSQKEYSSVIKQVLCFLADLDSRC